MLLWLKEKKIHDVDDKTIFFFKNKMYKMFINDGIFDIL